MNLNTFIVNVFCETDKDWCQSSETFEICDISDGRGAGIEIVVLRYY